MIIKKSESQDFVLPQTGLHQAVITSYVDCGTSEEVFQGETKRRRQMMIVFTLTNQHHDGENLTISRWFTASIHEKSNLFKFLSSFIKVDADLNMEVILGMNVMLNLVAYTKASGDSDVKVDMAAPLPNLDDAIQMPVSRFDLDNFNAEEFAALSDRMQARIKLSDEYKSQFAQ